ncbi:MAG TPA: porphobilinogen synthase [Candidatus Sumerlaeota bacterium]|nr:porphobilinogen synthase [Candidatus Sumerlaeota bacterium]HPS00052.1 porphobilinogen synthase [Candidatus Sumerlaeota bacterium]
MGFPVQRLRRLRQTDSLRRMVTETKISTDDFILPFFVVHGSGIKEEIEVLPGNYHLSVDKLVDEVKEARDLGIPAILLFGLPQEKNPAASEAYCSNGVVQQAIRVLKREVPDITVITDVCLCEYTEHGHCGIVENGYLLNDASLELIEKTTLSHAEAGVDMVAPAAMLDGQIARMRTALDAHDFQNVCIMGYSAKFASKLYDPFFKGGTKSAVSFGDKRSHQMNFANSDEAMREIALDIEEGADIVMVKPGIFYLDIVYRAKQTFGMPLAVYNVSGEYAMIKSADAMGRINGPAIMMELLTSYKRAGADLIITYFAKEAARLLKNQER